MNILHRALKSLDGFDKKYISSDHRFANTFALVTYFYINNSYPTLNELEKFLYNDFEKVPKSKIINSLQKSIENPSNTIFYDSTETTYAKYNTGIQRVNRKIYFELKEKITAFQWQAENGIAVANSDDENQYLLNYKTLLEKSIKSNRFNYHKPRSNLLLKIIRRFINLKFSRILRTKLSTQTKRLIINSAKRILYKKIVLPKNPVLKFIGNTILMTEYAYLDERILSRLTMLAKYGGTKVYLIIHDAIPMIHPEWVASPTIAGWVHLRKMAENATHIFVPSKSETNIIQKLIFNKEVKISTLYLSGELKFPVKISQNKKNKSSRKKIMILGSLDPRKNHVRSIHACLHVSAKLPIVLTIIAGGEWLSDNIRSAIDDASKKNKNLKINTLIGVTDEELMVQLRNTDLLLFCSLAEGFGLPLAEAGFLDLPVVCSNQGTVAEIGKLFANSFFVDPNSVLSIADGINRAFLSQTSYSPRFKKRTWNDVSRDILKAISKSSSK